MPANLIRERAGSSPFIKPYLHTLDRMQKREFPQPDELAERARLLLAERLGPSEGPVEAAFAHAATGLLGEHTHYFDGFGLLLLLPLGVAVAVRPARVPISRVVFDATETIWTFDRRRPADAPADAPGRPVGTCIVEQVLRRIEGGPTQVEAAVVVTMPVSGPDAFMAALGVATARALEALLGCSLEARPLLEAVRASVAAGTEAPFSIAYPLASDAGKPDAFALTDTATFERLLLDMPGRDVLGWGLVDLGTGPAREPAFFRKRKEMGDEAAEILQRKVFPGLTTLRDLEHRDLQRGLEVLPRRLRPAVRHLVTENRRVQKMVVAIRQRDWQMLGALLLMSHASQRNDWEGTSEEADLVVEQVEQMSIEGIYGGCMTGRGGCVLVVGQPFVVPHCLDRIQQALQARFGLSPDAMLL